jgi:hypothetical protein
MPASLPVPLGDERNPTAPITAHTRRQVAELAPIVLDFRSDLGVMASGRELVMTTSAQLPPMPSTSMGAAHQLQTPSHVLPDGQNSEMLPQHPSRESHARSQPPEPEDTAGRGRFMLPRVYTYHQQAAQRERQRQRYYAQRRRGSQQSAAGWVWLKVATRMRKSTVFFFEAIDAGRVDAVREMVRAQPSLLLRTRPGTRWTAVHHTAERGEFATLTALFEEAQHFNRASASGRAAALLCAPTRGRSHDYVKRMVNSLTEKNLTPLMLACKRG